MSIYAPNGWWRVQTSWKHDKPCDFHSPDIGTHADLCGRCGWKRHEHQANAPSTSEPEPQP